MFGGFKGSFLDNYLISKLNIIIKNLDQHMSATSSANVSGHIKLSHNADISTCGTYALDGVEKNSAVAGTLAKQILDMKSLLIPIGYIFEWEPVSGSEFDLSTSQKVHDYYGFGMWEQIKDRVLVGAGGIYTVGSVGGEATHTLSVNEIPSHSHSISGTTNETSNDHTHGGNTSSENTDHLHSGSTAGAGNHIHNFGVDITPGTNGNTIAFSKSANGTICNGISNYKTYINTYGVGDHAHAFATGWMDRNNTHQHTFNTGGQSAPHKHNYSGTSGVSGTGNEHNNMPPYKAVYIWKRIL